MDNNQLNKIACELNFCADKYYTSAEKMFMQNKNDEIKKIESITIMRI